MEDLQFGDITSEMLIPEDAIGSAYLIAKQSCVLTSEPVAALVFSKDQSSHQLQDAPATRVRPE